MKKIQVFCLVALVISCALVYPFVLSLHAKIVLYLILSLIFACLSSLYRIKERQAAIIERRGKFVDCVSKSSFFGLHWMLPFVEKCYLVDLVIKKKYVEASGINKDGKTILIGLSIRYRLNAEKIKEPFSSLIGHEAYLHDYTKDYIVKMITEGSLVDGLIRKNFLSDLEEKLSEEMAKHAYNIIFIAYNKLDENYE